MTTTPFRAAPTRTACPGCLDRRLCWVCDGRGTLVSRTGEQSRCHRCAGRTLCTVCSPEPPG